MAPKLRRFAMDEVKSRWATLLPEHRQAYLSFEDPFLVERIKCSLQALFEKQMVMSHLGLQIGDSPDPFASSTLFTTAFEFTWHIGRSKSNPAVALVDPACMPVMAMKLPFLQSVDFFQDLQCVLPDFLSLRSGRVPMPRARWKEIWAIEPSSVSQMEQSLVKLVEQALWSMMSKPACQLAIAEAPAPDPASKEVPLEAWMVDEPKERASAKKKKKNKGKTSPALKGVETAAELGAVDDMDAAMEERALEAQVSELDGALSEEDAGDIGDVGDIISETDESVGMGTFHVDGETSDFSQDPTASSTPAAGFGQKGNADPAQKALPACTNSKLAPPELVCYIWSQTAQFGQHQDGGDAAAQPSTVEPMSPTTCATPFSRGQWMEANQPGTPAMGGAKVVVRNTFVDIDDPEERPRTFTRARSLSPSHCYREDWHDHWHV